MVACLDLELEQLNIRIAFLRGNLKEKIYRHVSQDLEMEKKNLLCRLRKSLYGLKQAPRQWYKFDDFMQNQRYSECDYYNCVYLYMSASGTIVILMLYFDDMLATGNNMKEIKRLKHEMSKTFAT
eukprot:TRINITY_DN6582_c0_g1_i13.p1 TRINITY_DN6582_c0_g1~~TRINITY_DN6582_c0_g1_i13.p1  ORF type:complete len:132 (-),score=24.07 TRINITY_DN6582_c0_g1_i13:208-582(-)